ncbi:MAG: threonine synthase, partial [Ignavibacteria bacterium]|nr:threonine synthase [Ignavibacteria bacterium]
MKYISVLGKSPSVSFREAVFQGLAPDGGLYVPENIPQLPLPMMADSATADLPDVGCSVTSPFIGDIEPDVLQRTVRSALAFPIPLVKLQPNLYLLELFHGPTLAFKDVGARFMAETLGFFLQKEKDHLTILVATSGDTGSAVAHGFYGVPRIDVFILYPSGKISTLQEQQMTTLGNNIHAVEVDGTFDDCQRLVKETFLTKQITMRKRVTTANSINVGRLIPQISYYFWGLVQLRHRFDIRDRPVYVVPSGNLGNLTAAMYARAMGAPIERCVAATNVNDVLPEFLRTGRIRPRPSVRTYSNAMDVGNPSNFARLQHLVGSDNALRAELEGFRVSDEETFREIRRTFDETGYILDPHTAVGMTVARKVQEDWHGPIVVPATAHAAKFPEVINQALGQTIPLPPPLADAMGKQKQTTRIGPEMKQWMEVV